MLSAPDATVAIPDESAELIRAIDRCLRAQAEWLVSEALLVDAILGDGKRHPFLAGLRKGYPEFDPNQPRDEFGRWVRVGPSGSAPDDYRLIPLAGDRDRRIPPPRWPFRRRPDDPHAHVDPPLERPDRGDLPYEPDLNDPNFLRREEAGRLGGHTYARHIDVTLRNLQSRSRFENASRWIDEGMANRIAPEMILLKQEEIAEWLRSETNQFKDLDYTGDDKTKIGEGYDRGNSKLKDRYNATIRLKKDGIGGYRVITAFPR